jgi:hypothetical protein
MSTNNHKIRFKKTINDQYITSAYSYIKKEYVNKKNINFILYNTKKIIVKIDILYFIVIHLLYYFAIPFS